MDYRLALMCGSDIPVPQCQLTIHQPRMKEISLIGEESFFTAIQCLNVNKKMIKQDETLLTDINNFQIFMTIMTEKETVEKKEAVLQLFQLICPDYKINILPRSIILNKEGQQSIMIDENNFESLQIVLRDIFCLNSQEMAMQTGYNPANAKAQEIAEKLMKGRQRVAMQNGEDKGSMFSQYLSTLTIGVASMSLHDALNLTMFQLLGLMERYSLYTNWDIDIRARLAGASIEDKPDNWMKNIH